MIALRRICILIFIGVGLSSCNNIYYKLGGKNNKFTYKFDGKYTGIDTLINIDGYYEWEVQKCVYDTTLSLNENLRLHSGCINPDLKTCLLFYRDGTFASFFHNTKDNLIDPMDRTFGWGRYFITGDTIKIQIVNVGKIEINKYTDGRVGIFERSFKIISRDSINEILYNEIFNSESRFLNSDKEWYKYQKYFFTPMPNRPDSSCWLKNNSWAWKDGKIIK